MIEGTRASFKIMVAEHVAFRQLDKCDCNGQVINHWILLAMPVSCESNQDENYDNNQLEDIVFMYQQILRTLMCREMKDSEGELKMVNLDMKSVQVYMYTVYSFTRLKNLKFKLASRARALKFCLPWASFGLPFSNS